MPFNSPSSVVRVDVPGQGEGDLQVKVEVLSNGDFVFVWREYENNDVNAARIFVRRYTDTLVPRTPGAQQKIDGAMTDQAGNGFTTPSIVAGPDGTFIVEYNDFGGGTNYSDGSFYAGRVWSWLAGFDGNGDLYAQIGMLGIPNINDPVQNQSITTSTISPNGEGGYHTLAAQNFFASNPNARYLLLNGQQVDIGLATPGQISADIADAGDSAFIVWQRSPTGGDADIFAMIVGQPMIRLNTQVAGAQTLSQVGDSIAVLSDGSFVVVWSDASDLPTDPLGGVRARIIGADGVPRTGEIILPNIPLEAESRPMVAALNNGYWLAVWNDSRGAVGQMFNSDGERYGAEQVLIPGIPVGTIAAMAITPDNLLVMSWYTGTNSLGGIGGTETHAQTWQLAFSNTAPTVGGNAASSALDVYEVLGGTNQVFVVDASEGVLANDFDLDGDSLTAVLTDAPQNGALTLNPDGSFQYTPDPLFFGSDFFFYEARDGTGNATQSLVNIYVRRTELLDRKAYVLDIVNRFNQFVGDPEQYDETVFSGPFGDAQFAILEQIASLAVIVLSVGSLKFDIDFDGDGTFETQITFEDPVPNVTVIVESLPDRTVLSFDPLPAATAANDTINGTVGPDYIGGDAGNDTLRGLDGNDALVGGDGNDSLLPGKGIDSVDGGAGSDGIYFGKELGSNDKVDGGLDSDTLAIQGNYPALVLGAVTNIETLFPVPGNDTRFGDIAGNLYDYNVTTVDSNVAAGGRLTVTAGVLRPGEDLTFDGSAETDGDFRVFAGQGVDNHKGGAGSDGFFFGADRNLTGADRVDGNGGPDSIALRGNYFGADAVTFQNASLSDIEAVVLLSGHTSEFGGFIVLAGFDYTLTMADGNAAAGQRLDISAFNLRSNETLVFNGAAELDGSYRITSGAADDSLTGSAGADTIFGGLGADVIAGGPGNDTYVYRDVLESTAASRDTINGFAAGDRIDLAVIDANTGVAGNDAFAFIGTGAFTNTAGQLRASQSGADTLIEADVNGDGVADLSILVTATTAANFVAGDFVL